MEMSKFAWLMSRQRLLSLGLAFLLGAGLAFAGFSLSSAAPEGDVVAVVNGQVITREEFYNRLEELAGEQVLDQIIMEKVVAQAEESRGVLVSDEEVQAELDRIVESFGSEEAFHEELSRYGLTLERLLFEIRLDLILTKLSRQGIVISDEEINEFFEANKTHLDTPERILVRHILVETEEEAREILAQLADGADFEDLAKAKSIDTASGVQGGEVGYIHEGSPVVEEFKAAAFELEVGEVSEPVFTQFGWHIIRVDARLEAEEASLEKSREFIVDYLTEQKARPIGEILNELRSEAEVDVRWPRYEAFRTVGAAQQGNEPADE